ncbi:MAG TPA: potassium-transporting ATPase subunit KdpA, partial [Planctomycetia bacterium]|nr:potassium-transporting ATPase subunit KdpA [Planctomycetia bacterium]
MTGSAWVQFGLYLGALLALGYPLGLFMARLYEGKPCGVDRALGWLERGLYRIAGVDPAHEMTWKTYALAILAFNGVGLLATYLLLRLQGILPFNPEGLAGATPDLAFNTAVSFATNTNWQSYGGESTLSYLSQFLALAVQNFVSAAAGMAVLAALVRGFARRQANVIGNAWVDLTRSTVYILLPLSFVLALALVSQGMIQNFSPYAKATLIEATADGDGKPAPEQTLPMGPAASQVAIKQLGTNGGGFFNVNSAHPYENPTPLSNFLEVLAILVIPAGLCFT